MADESRIAVFTVLHFSIEAGQGVELDAQGWEGVGSGRDARYC
jgi:hypothetical protein